MLVLKVRQQPWSLSTRPEKNQQPARLGRESPRGSDSHLGVFLLLPLTRTLSFSLLSLSSVNLAAAKTNKQLLKTLHQLFNSCYFDECFGQNRPFLYIKISYSLKLRK